MDVLTPQSNVTDNSHPLSASGSGIPITQFALREYFDNWRPDTSEQDAMNAISELAQGRGITAKGDLFQLIRDVEMKIGAQNNRPRAVLKYLQVLNQIDDLTKIRDSYARK